MCNLNRVFQLLCVCLTLYVLYFNNHTVINEIWYTVTTINLETTRVFRQSGNVTNVLLTSSTLSLRCFCINAALIVHQHPAVANEVGVEILYLKVVDSNGFFQAFSDHISDDSFGAISQPHDHAGVQGACLDPALALNVEGMLRGCVDSLGLAVLNQKEGRLKEANDQLTTLITAHPQDASLYAARADVEKEQKAYDLALLDLEEAIRLQPDNAQHYLSRAAIYVKQDRKKQARADLDRAVELGVSRASLDGFMKENE